MYTQEDLKQLEDKLSTLKKLKDSLYKVKNGNNSGAQLSFEYWRVLKYTDGTTENRKYETKLYRPVAVMPTILSALTAYYADAIKKLESEIDSINIYNFSKL